MIKNAYLSIKKNIGKTLILFILMCIITNLVIAGLSIQNATSKSMEQVRTSLGSEVTLSYNMRNMMKGREKGEALDATIQPMTIEMADSLKDLQYVDHYNYMVNTSVSSDDIEPVKTNEDNDSTESKRQLPQMDQPRMLDQNDFTVVGYTTMAYVSEFTKENYVLKSGRLLTEKDNQTKNCVIEVNLANDNDLKVGSTFQVIATHDDEEISETLKVVGIYEVETTSQMGGMMSNRQNPINQIYTSLKTAQKLNNSTTDISSATYYLDDPEHIDEFKELAQSKKIIDFDIYTLDANDHSYQRSISLLENMQSFATIFLWIVIITGSFILCLVLILTLRHRFYEFGVFLSLGQSKLKIILQQLIEIGIVFSLAFALSLGTGKMVSNVMSSMLENSQNQQEQPKMEISDNEQQTLSSNDKFKEKNIFNKAMQAPTDTALDVSLTTETILQLAQITGLICIVSIILPSVYILRLSPREILIRKEM